MCNTKTACGHQFCEVRCALRSGVVSAQTIQACINAWLREHLTCPLCRNGMQPRILTCLYLTHAVIAPSHVTVYRTNDAYAT